MTMRVRDVMREAVVAVTADSSFADVVATLKGFGVGAVPVIDAGRRVLGVVSEEDLLVAETRGGAPGGRAGRAGAATAGELMTAPAVTVTPGTPVRRAASLMHDRRVRQLPVVDPVHGRVLGIVRRSDLLKVFNRPASELRAAVRRAIAERTGVDPAGLTIAVADGVVTVGGPALTRFHPAGLAGLAEAAGAVDGVIAVELVEREVDAGDDGPGR